MTTRRIVPPELAGERADRVVAGVAGISRRAARGVLSEGRVRLDGRPLRNLSRPLEAGDVLDLEGFAADLIDPYPTPPLPSVLYHDRHLLALDKPAGMLSQPSARSPGERAADQVALLALAAQDGRRPFVRLIHRLDRATSGVLLLALDPRTTAELAEQWRSGRVRRRYLAVVAGEPVLDQQRVEAPIGKQPGAWKFRVDGDGEPAATEVRVVERRGGQALVECELITGRTHQVRVHLASIGHPVVGDRLYGGPDAERLLLHAATLELPRRGDAPLEIRAPTPPALLRA